MFYTESEYKEYMQKTRFSRTIGEFFPVLPILGAFTIGLFFGLASKNIFNTISSFWYICGIGFLVYFMIRHSLKVRAQNSYSIMSPGEWLWKPSVPVKFWIKNDQVITLDTQKAHLQSEISDTGEMIFFSVLLSFIIVEIPYFILTSALYLFQEYDASIILPLHTITLGMLVLFFFGYSLLLPLFIIFVGRRFIQWTITKSSVSDVEINYRNLDAKHFRTLLPLTSMLSGSILEYPIRDLFTGSRINRFFMKRMSETVLNSSMYALVIAVPIPIVSKSDGVHTAPHSTSNIILLRNKNKTVVEDFQKALSAWVRA